MRLASFSVNGTTDVGLIVADGIVSLKKRLGVSNLRQLIAENLIEESKNFCSDQADYQPSDVTWLPLIHNAAHFVCVGTNYKDHLKEVQDAGVIRPQPQHPPLFIRVPESLAAHGANLQIPSVSTSFDYEGELAVIIGRGGRNIPESEALSCVAGYSCFNDGSIRDWQYHTTQITSGKNFVSTGGFGPWMVTTDEIPDPQTLKIITKLNGITLQDGNTADMIFSVARIISYISTIFPLLPGDVIITGTPSGVGFSRKPPIFMKPGDICEVSIEKIGTLSNMITNIIVPA